MDAATDFQDQESLGHPRNQVYVIFSGADQARRAAQGLNQLGIEPAKIGFLVGKEDAAKLDAATGEHGFLAKIARVGLEMGDTDADYLAYYRRALLEGKAVISVVVSDQASREKVRKLLKRCAGHAMTYFGQFTTEIWEG